jgi:hypothetical protein
MKREKWSSEKQKKRVGVVVVEHAFLLKSVA